MSRTATSDGSKLLLDATGVTDKVRVLAKAIAKELAEIKEKTKGLLARKMDNPNYRKRHEESYELFKLEVQLLNALERKHMTYEDLAKVLHTNKSNISRDLKAGGIQNASLSRIIKMAKALGMKFLPLMIPEEKQKIIIPKIQKLAVA